MNALGPVEPGDGTRPLNAPPRPGGPLGSRHGRLARLYGRHRRPVLAALGAAAVLASGVLLHLTRPRQPPPPEPPFPPQVTAITYLKPQARGPDTDNRNFTFHVQLAVESGPPVTLVRISQPYAGLSTSSSPPTPFRTVAGSPRKIAITLRVTECGELPENVGLPFLDVTLRNTHAMRSHSFILGPRYTRDLSAALQVACGNGFR
ncbi:hypothetical protein SAMN05216505_101960 [Streptomyces prasinopilosus]|uniref:Tat pathway signal sequence domain protein n=1 Tax=Streptomyces prasinopilosus TaxID=67344 RepID=A0A1G6K6Z0_9ACTN|nr:Tat pathway signal sequence domain protein [Streptomyces prasinopilosus]SDC26096.1 hypothetical protein SAMN05216505_101960 [Streptomyces prasinopilosus]